MKIYALVTGFILGFQLQVYSQDILTDKTSYTHQDTLRGSITPERAWWDLTYYHLDIKIDPEKKYISGKNTIQYTVLKPYSVLQVDLQEPLKITKAIQNNKELDVRQDGNAHFITLFEEQIKDSIHSVVVYYEGIPKEAVNAPWDGGFTWAEDKNHIPFIATSCQGIGASVWWPNKDHMYDEVDSMLISVNVPKNLTNISNGRLRHTERKNDDTVTSHWFVNNPINNYGVNVNIGDYVHFSEIYEGENGPLSMDYYVLRDNLIRAKNHFKEAPKMMKAFEHWFGPYPFYEDGYKLVEAPYLGMEHQSSVTYGNQFKNGYLGRDISESGWGLKFDFIIIHESGHEWFANNITYKDVADMWIHESFTSYSESLFVEYYFGKEAGAEYVLGVRNNISNDRPIIGSYNVNKRGSTDMYNKGSNMLHTLRQIINDDEKWRSILRGLNKTFYHQTVTTEQIENDMSAKTEIDLNPFFNQYLRDTRIPTFEYIIENKQLKYRWTKIVENFELSLKITDNENELWIYPTSKWKTQPLEGTQIKIDPNFYIESNIITKD